ncbi:PRC-barrel domain-containing protein [Loktanella sp. DJP18]|uniref:PRC-barrel domain-containing protein n=1 Tax=Loktanella sp. DJP18 TaxID=3409788 RepID=UPI003BB4E448
MTHAVQRLFLTTALCLPFGQAAFAQSETFCADLETALNNGLPASLSEETDRIRSVLTAGDPAACEVELVAILAVTDEAAQTDEAAEGAQLTETEELTVNLQDELTVQGAVYLDRQPANVDIEGGDTEVVVTNDQPEVTVNEGQAEIVIRQAAANVMVEMPQPTIRIEQPAPEIIITMPAPGVDVANARPQVDVRQAEPTVTVTQAAPMVALELERVAEGEEAANVVTDRASGNTYAVGETAEATTLEDATVNMVQNEPTVIYEDGEAREPTINRAEPNVTFESAEPQVEVATMGEPQIEMIQTGEPQITFQQAADAADTEASAAMAQDGVTEDDAAAATEADALPEDIAPISEQGADAIDAEPIGDEAAIDSEAAETDGAAVDPAMTDQAAATAPVMTREGYTPIAIADLLPETVQGMNVYSTNDEDVGEVRTVVVTPEGAVQGLVVNVGGFLGLGERQVEVPVEMATVLTNDSGDIRIYVDATENRLEDMPEYDG